MTTVAGRLFSIGRVQTPTLALVVQREEEIERFVPEPYWRVVCDVEPRTPKDEVFKARWIDPKKKEHPDRIAKEETAAALAEKLRGAEGTVA